jgi:XTP/dITP diphosphohydrolase
MAERVLVIATHNAGKAVELRAMLSRVRVETLADHPSIVMPPEGADTFEENARAKAEHVTRVLGSVAIADDSGLCVDALGGAPGVRSARYAEGTDGDRVSKLLHELAGVADAQRSARFVCAIAFAAPGQAVRIERGECEGRIAQAPRGTSGFGYDPVFIVEGLGGRTMAELGPAEKNRISHRARALTQMLPHLERYFSS